MIKPGDVVTVDFPGVQGIKRRPAVVISTNEYHTQRPDVIIGLLTTQLNKASASTDYVLQDWAAAGLHQETVFRSFLATMPASTIKIIGHLAPQDWHAIQLRLKLAIATS